MVINELSNEEIKALSTLSVQLKNEKAEYARLEEELKKKAERVRQLEMVELPDMMTELGVEKLSLLDGTVIAVLPVISASITKQNEDAAHAWLREKGFGDLIKERYVCNVHPSTLKAWVRERLEAGESIPEALFSVWAGRKAVVK